MPPNGNGTVSMNFQLAGAPGDPAERQVFQGNWWYRVAGDTRERYLGSPSMRTTSGSNYVKWTFPDVYLGAVPVPDVYVEMDFNLTGVSPNSAALSTGLCFYNLGSAPLFVDAILALDIDLNATIPGDFYLPTNTTSGRQITIVDGWATAVLSGGQAVGSGSDEASTIFGRLNNNTVTHFIPDLNPLGNPLGGPYLDGAAALQWQFRVDPSAMPVCDPAMILTISRVPEPSGLVVVVGSLLAMAAQFRRGRDRRAHRPNVSLIAPGRKLTNTYLCRHVGARVSQLRRSTVSFGCFLEENESLTSQREQGARAVERQLDHGRIAGASQRSTWPW